MKIFKKQFIKKCFSDIKKPKDVYILFFVVFLLFSQYLFVNAGNSKKLVNFKENKKLEERIIYYLNQERIKHNLEPLVFNSILKKAADLKVDDMLEKKYFAHTSPSGEKAWDILRKVHYDYIFAGENLAMNFNDAEELHRAWMNSDKHRENILFPDYTDVAVSIGKRNNNSLVVAEYFGRPEELSSSSKKQTKKSQIVAGIKSDRDNNIVFNNLKTSIAEIQTISQNNPLIFWDHQVDKDKIFNVNNMILLVLEIGALILIMNVWMLQKDDEMLVDKIEKGQSCGI